MCVFVLCFYFFFSSRRRHTRSLCDWSSDVCSSDLVFTRENAYGLDASQMTAQATDTGLDLTAGGLVWAGGQERASGRVTARFRTEGEDRKSTRLNSSHTVISYAVFCLKKKNK